MSDLVKSLALIGAIIGVLKYGLEGAIGFAIIGAIISGIIDSLSKR